MPVFYVTQKDLKVGDVLDDGRRVLEVQNRPAMSVLIRNHNARLWNRSHPDQQIPLEPETPLTWARVSGV